MTLSITTLCHYDECRYAVCLILFFVVPKGIMLNVLMVNAIMLYGNMLSVVIVNVYVPLT